MEKDRNFEIKNEALLLPFLQTALSEKSRSTIKSILGNGQVVVNGKTVTQFNKELHIGDRVEVSMVKNKVRSPHPQIEIVYEDDDLIVINKAEGLNTIAVANSRIPNAYHILDQYVKRQGKSHRIYIVHRLDRDTSGLLLFAKTPKAQGILRQNWDKMVEERAYVAVVEGVPTQKNGRIESFLVENEKSLQVYSVDNGEGKLAITHYKTLKTNLVYALLQLDLETGRKNQIRVHMSEMGHPVAGDEKYGAQSNPIHRLALHARQLKFEHPITHKMMNFETPIPDKFMNLLK